jgi:hypothetical protein
MLFTFGKGVYDSILRILMFAKHKNQIIYIKCLQHSLGHVPFLNTM